MSEMHLKTLLLDVSETSQTELKTGIQRVAQSLLLAFLQHPPQGYRVIPVHLIRSSEHEPWHYECAHEYSKKLGVSQLLDANASQIVQEMRLHAGDRVLVLDVSGVRLIEAVEQGLFANLRTLGVAMQAIVYDLLPLLHPEYFPVGSFEQSERWYRALVSPNGLDGVLSISRAVAQDFEIWYQAQNFAKRDHFGIGWFHLGSDFEGASASTNSISNSKAGKGSTLSPFVDAALEHMQQRPTFLMVGTLEPRKGYLQAIAAFNELWKQGVKANLVIVGKEGWTALPGPQRRTIPQIIRAIGINEQLGQELFWLEEVSDQALIELYGASTCVLIASEAEGFGLPIIEAAHYGLPVIVRDIPVFREVAGEGAYYFDGQSPDELADAIQNWLTLHKKQSAPSSKAIKPLTWQQSATQLWQFALQQF
jgi:glycosyltransferase involved in cell wall biosynthesis